MGTGFGRSIVNEELGRAIALDIAGYVHEFPGCNEADIAASLKISAPQLSEAKRGDYHIKAAQVIAMKRLGMTRTLTVLNEIAERDTTATNPALTFSRALEQHRAAGETTRATFDALKDNIIDPAEFATCEARILDEINACKNLLRTLRAAKGK